MTKKEIMKLIEFDEKTQTLKLNIKNDWIIIDGSDSETRGVDFRNAKTGYVDFSNAKTGNVDFTNAKTRDYVFDTKIKIDGKVYDRDCTDGLNMGITKVISKGRVTRLEGISLYGDKTFLYKTQNLAYHSWISIEDAKEGYKRKLKQIKEGMGKWVKTLKDNSIITDEIFHEQTGSCYPGIKAWKERAGISDKKEITFKEFKELATNNPTPETRRVMTALEVMKEGNDA